MCLVAIAWRAHPHYPLVVAGNRDAAHQAEPFKQRQRAVDRHEAQAGAGAAGAGEKILGPRPRVRLVERGDDLESPEEFFAASMEAFLESAGVLAEAFPDLYERLSAYLHLDPRQWSGRLNDVSAS